MTPEITPGFWWARHKHDGSLTVVQITNVGGLGVMFIGNLSWPDLDEADIELIAKIEPPVTVGK